MYIFYILSHISQIFVHFLRIWLPVTVSSQQLRLKALLSTLRIRSSFPSYELQVHPHLILTENSGVALSLGQGLSHEQIMQITLDEAILEGTTNWSDFPLLKALTDSVDSFSPSQTCLLHLVASLVRPWVRTFALAVFKSDQGTTFWVERWRGEANFSPWSALLWRIGEAGERRSQKSTHMDRKTLCLNACDR